MKRYDAVIFDLDGTLLNTLEDLTDAVNYVMRHYQFEEKTISQVRSYVGNGIRKLVERCVPGGREREDFEKIFQCFRRFYTAHCQEKTKPYDGIMELLKVLSDRGYQMGIVSNKNDTAVEELNEIFFAEYISVAIGQNDQLRPKPAPDTVNMALKRLSCTRERAVYVGDSNVDKATADNSGMDCVSVTWGFRDRELLESLKPAAIIDQPQQLLKFLEE
ncbi:MAG: HAD-IA family hydrolase [Lachnospiraceae bacterium]|nr:HAD-IA family hydrolase [Lachnospiraceae bacterium]